MIPIWKGRELCEGVSKGVASLLQLPRGEPVKVECTLIATKLVQTPAPVTLDITDGRHGKVEAPKAMDQSFSVY